MFTVTGTSSTRLVELKKYTSTGTLSDRYFTSTSSTTDGVNVSLTVEPTKYVYYIGGITYMDSIVGTATTTTFTFQSLGLDDPNNFEDKPIIMIESKQGMLEEPVIESDVFITRQEIPVFESSIRLRAINNLNQVSQYAGGNYFKIYENT